MFRNLCLLCALVALLAACSGESPRGTVTLPAPEQPVIATPIATNPPPTGTTPMMIEPPEQGAPKPINSAHLPQREDGNLARGNVTIDRSELLVMESYPIQVTLVLGGSLPTPCHELRVIAKPPDEENRIQVEAYSVTDPAQLCAQALEAFEANIGLGSFQSGHYSVWVNGEKAGEFDA